MKEDKSNIPDINSISLPPQVIDQVPASAEEYKEETQELPTSPKHCTKLEFLIWHNRKISTYTIIPEESALSYEGSNSAITRLHHPKLTGNEITIIKLEDIQIFINHEMSPNILLNGHREVQVMQNCRERMLVKFNNTWVIIPGLHSNSRLLQKNMLDTFEIRRCPGAGQMSLFNEKNVWWSDSLNPCLIGTHELCDFIIDNENVESFHAVIYISHDGLYIEDLTVDKPGLFLNGKKLSGRRHIVKGDIISIAGEEIKFDFKGNISLIAKKNFTPPNSRKHQLRLSCLDGSEPAVIQLGDEVDFTTIGRGDEVDIVLEHHSVSRRHARFFYRNNSLWVEDLGSSNGTWINSTRIEKAKARAGDIIEFGDNTFLVIFAT